MTYHWHFEAIWPYHRLVLAGIGVTLGLTLATALLGLLVGLLVAVARIGGLRTVALPLTALTEFFRCTPVLIQLVWCFYALPVLIGVSLSPVVAAVATLSLYGGAFYAEIIRGGIVSIEDGQWEAGRALGMEGWVLMRHVVLPQALRRMVPPLINQTILQLKNTSLVSVLAVPDLLYDGQLITSASYRPLETYTVVAALYFLMLFPLTRLARRLERRLA